MTSRTSDARNADNLSYLCSRQYEDYLDWLENKNRPSLDLFKPFRLLRALAVGVLGSILLMR